MAGPYGVSMYCARWLRADRRFLHFAGLDCVVVQAVPEHLAGVEHLHAAADKGVLVELVVAEALAQLVPDVLLVLAFDLVVEGEERQLQEIRMNAPLSVN